MVEKEVGELGGSEEEGHAGMRGVYPGRKERDSWVSGGEKGGLCEEDIECEDCPCALASERNVWDGEVGEEGGNDF